MDQFRESNDVLNDGQSLRRRLDEDSYLFFRGLIDSSEVARVRMDVLEGLRDCGWLAAGTDPDAAEPSPNACRESGDPRFLQAYIAIQRLQSFNELAHDSALVWTVRQIMGDDAFPCPAKIARITIPDPTFVTPPHQDYPLVQGTADVLTTWIPLGECPAELGGLRILRGSHHAGVRPVQKMFGPGSLGVDADDDDPRWATTDYKAGDVLMFHSLSVHAAQPNRTNRLRLSVDYRFQSASEPISETNVLPHRYPEVPGFEELTAGWSSLRGISHPDHLEIVGRFDPLRGEVRVRESRLVSLDQ